MRSGARRLFAFVRTRAPEIGIICCYVALHLHLVEPAVQNGDAGEYNRAIDLGEWGPATTHVGYVALGRLLRLLVPGNIDVLMNYVCVVFGTLGGVGVYATARRYAIAVPTAMMAGLSLLCIPSYLRGMVLSEVDVPLAATCIVALAATVWSKPVLAGFAIGWAMLISPLAATFTPLLVLAAPMAGDGKQAALQHIRRLALTAAIALALYVPVVLAFREDYFFGPRGMLFAPRLSYNLPEHFERAVSFLRREVPDWLVPGVIGICALGSKHIRGIGSPLPGLCVCSAATLVLGERFVDVPVLLPVLTVAAVGVAAAVDQFSRLVRYAPSLAFAVFLVWQYPSSLKRIEAEVVRVRTDRRLIELMTASSPHNILVVWNDRRRIELDRLARSVANPPTVWTERNFKKRQCRLRDAVPQPTVWFFSGRLSIGACLKREYNFSEVAMDGFDRRFAALVPAQRN